MAKNKNNGVTETSPGRWEIRFRFLDPLTQTRKRYKKRHNVRGEQEALALLHQLKLNLTRSGEEKARVLRVRDCLPSYQRYRVRTSRGARRSKGLQQSTLELEAQTLDQHLLPLIGDWIVSQITLADLEWVVETLMAKPLTRWDQKKKEHVTVEGKTYANSTINGWLKTKRKFLGFIWGRYELPGRCPAELLEPLPEDPPDHEGLTIEEAQAFLMSAYESSRDYAWMFALAMLTSRRFSMISALHWDEVDYNKPLAFTFSQSEGRRSRGDKVGKWHLFPMLEQIELGFQEHRRHLIATCHPGVHSGIVFPARVGDPAAAKYKGYLGRSSVNKTIKRIAKHAKIGRNVTFHTLRHTSNTLLVSSHISDTMTRAITGHATPRMTGHYAKNIPMEARQAVVIPIAEKLLGGPKVGRSGLLGIQKVE